MLSRRLFFALTGGALAAPVSSWGAGVPAVLDHILLGCSDLDRGIAFVQRATGVRAALGGVHPGRGTRNALLSLGEKHYLEIIAPDPAQPAAPDPYGLKKLTEPRLVGWAAHPGDLDQFASRLRTVGITFDGPTPGSRKRPDGGLLQWKTLNLQDDHQGILPFFIEWSAATVHPSLDAPSGCNIINFAITAPNDAELDHLCKLLDLDVAVVHGAPAAFRATLQGAHGSITLSSQNPPKLVTR